jgi:serine/threonine-protein kinase PRP4
LAGRHFPSNLTQYLRLLWQAMNLRELTRKVARNVGINLPAVQLFGKQMLAALYHMQECGVLHADIKPDNILVNARHNAVKVRCAAASPMHQGVLCCAVLCCADSRRCKLLRQCCLILTSHCG